MKTIDEASSELYHSTDLGDNMDHNDFKTIFKSGVEFAQRWISVEDEKPEINQYGFTEELLTKLGSLIVIQKGFMNNNGYFMWCDEPCTHWRPIELK